MSEREKVLKEVWQKWCELPAIEFDKWLHNSMNNIEEKPVYKENWNPDWKGDPDDPNRWNGW